MTSRLTHERAKMGLFHEGDVASAIAAAKAKGKPLLVFILGTDSASAAMERALDGSGSDDEGGDLRDEAGHAGWVAVRLEEGGTDAANFRALCPAEPAPVAVAVDTTTGAKIGEASNEDLSFVAANLEVFRQTHEADLRLRTMTALAQLAGAQASAPPAAPAEVTPPPPEEEEPRPRNHDDPQNASASDDADAIFAKAKAEAEMAAARAEMAAKIKSEAALKRAAAIEDRAKREAEAEKKRVEAETSRAAEKKRAEEEARVKLGVAARIQLPDGSQLTARLPAGATIGDVRAFLVANADGGEGMELWNTWPRAKLDESDQGATVAEDLGLGARPSLLALVKSGGSSGGMVRGARRYTQRQQEAAGVDRVGRGGGGWFERLLEIFRKIWGVRVRLPGSQPGGDLSANGSRGSGRGRPRGVPAGRTRRRRRRRDDRGAAAARTFTHSGVCERTTTRSQGRFQRPVLERQLDAVRRRSRGRRRSGRTHGRLLHVTKRMNESNYALNEMNERSERRGTFTPARFPSPTPGTSGRRARRTTLHPPGPGQRVHDVIRDILRDQRPRRTSCPRTRSPPLSCPL